ncbi:MAG: hypothetical protein QM730_24715 [Anaerolineales bacterium]
MAKPLIAIVGSYDPTREQELQLRDVATAPKAAELLGQALAASGFHIVVYASYPHMLEVDVVKGFCSAKNAEADSIHVYYSQKYGRPSFHEESTAPALFKFYPDSRDDWEISFYHSLSAVDGILILGGGHSTLVAGLVAIGHKKPIVACSGFGGAGQKIWDAIPTLDTVVSLDDKFLMAEQRWSPQLAEKLVKLLQKQLDELKQKDVMRLDAERNAILKKAEELKRTDQNITFHAVVASIMFILSTAMWPVAWGVKLDLFWLWALLIFAPLFSGISGAMIRVVFDSMQGKVRLKQLSLIRNMVLGLVTGGMTAFLFIIAQVFSNPAAIEPTVGAETLKRLLPFSLVIGFVAGLTLDIVLSKLRETNVVNTGVIKVTEETVEA